MKKVILFCYLFMSQYFVMAQLEQLAQVEIPTNSEKEEEHLIFTLNENGVLLLHTEEDILHRKIKLEFTKLDSKLKNFWKKEFIFTK